MIYVWFRDFSCVLHHGGVTMDACTAPMMPWYETILFNRKVVTSIIQHTPRLFSPKMTSADTKLF